REQALNADLRLRLGVRAGADARAQVAAFALVLGRGRDRASDLSSQPAMECPKPLSFPGTASQYPAQRKGCGPLTDNVSRPGDSGDAAIELTDLVGRLVVSLLRQGRREVSRTGLGVVNDSRRHHGAQPACLLLVPGVPGSVRGRQCGVGTVAVRSPCAL